MSIDVLLVHISDDHTQPEIGARYVLREPDDDPFQEEYSAVVLDVQRGWVQYYFTEPTRKWSTKVISFNRIYTKKK